MILRHWDTTYTPERIRNLPTNHGFVCTDGHGQDEIAVEEMREGKRGWDYMNVLVKPSWPDPLPPYLHFVRHVAPTLVHPVTGNPIASWARGLPLIDWARMDSGKLLEMAQLIRRSVRRLDQPADPTSPTSGQIGFYGAFLDLPYLRPRDWMFPADYLDFPPEYWVHWERRFRRFFQLLDQLGVNTIANGDRECPWALYMEYAELTWSRDYSIWIGDWEDPNSPRKTEHVLSVEARDEDAVTRLIDAHRLHPRRWIAFSTRSNSDEAQQATDLAYQMAAA